MAETTQQEQNLCAPPAVAHWLGRPLPDLCVPRVAAHAFFEPLTAMPELAHWANRPEPFAAEHSAVLAWICAAYAVDLPRAQFIFYTAKSKHVLAVDFDRDKRLWRGNVVWRPNFERVGQAENVFARKQRQPRQPRRREPRQPQRRRGRDPKFSRLAQLSIEKRMRAGVSAGVPTSQLQRQMEERFHVKPRMFYVLLRQLKVATP